MSREESPTRRSTRIATSELTLKVLKGSELFDDSEIEYLTKTMRLRSLNALVTIYLDNQEERFLNDEKFPFGACEALRHLGAFIEWFLRGGNSLQKLAVNEVLQDMLESFNPAMIKPSDDLDRLSKSQENPVSSLKIKLSDYPRFSGKTSDWKAFYESFTSICSFDHGIKDLLKEDEEHEENIVPTSSIKRAVTTYIIYLRWSARRA